MSNPPSNSDKAPFEHPDTDPGEPTPPSMDPAALERLLESSSKITLATAGGAMVGLTLERQQQLLQQQPGHSRRRPPQAMRTQVQSQQLPKTWALRCMLFTSTLETSHLTSPTTSLLQLFSAWTRGETNSSTSSRELPPSWMVTIADFSIGGLVAGLVSAVANRRRHSRQLGVTAGLVLGGVAGAVQAALDAANRYLEEQIPTDSIVVESSSDKRGDPQKQAGAKDIRRARETREM